MTPKEFRAILEGAMSQNQESIERLLALYAPLIDKHSRIHKVIDEDLRQHLVLYILLHIHEFPLDEPK